MLTWLRNRPSSTRRAARPANVQPETAPAPKTSAAPPVNDELPPPFFSDDDTAFLDLEDRPTAVAATNQTLVNAVAPTASAESRLSQAILQLPKFPDRRDPNRIYELLSIFRTLDRIAGDATAHVIP